MTIPSILRTAGGILPVRDLVTAGFTPHAIRRAVAACTANRPQRGWIALPGTDPELLQAARSGTILSCVSVAHRHGLWRRHDSGWHFAVRSRHAHPRTPHTLHWRKPVRRREPATLVDSIENALNYVAYCQPPEEALAIWESALRRRLVTLDALRRYPYAGRARELLEQATPFSDSGLESYVGKRLRALRLRFVAQAYIGENRRDFLIEGWLLLEVDGATHTGEQRDLDNLRDAEMLINGRDTVRASYRQIFEDWPTVQGSIMQLLSQGTPMARAGDRSPGGRKPRIRPPGSRSPAWE